LLYVLDTSVILSDPRCLERLSDKNIVIPLVVLTELEAKRTHPELGYPARTALRTLEEYRRYYKSLTEEIRTSQNGTIRVEINHIDDSELPDALRTAENDNRILAVASNLGKSNPVTLLTKDLPLRLKASIAGVEASDYNFDTIDVDWSGVVEIDVTDSIVDELYETETMFISGTIDQPVNTCFIITSSSGHSALGRLKADGHVHLVKNRKLFDLGGRSAEQRFAIDILNDDSVGIVSLAGKAGTGKSSLALAAGLESVIEKRKHKKVTVFRPLYAVGGQDLGFLPGTAEEKMSPWAEAIYDCLDGFCGENVIEQIIEEELLEILPLTHIRGRTLTNSFVIIEEAQNLDSMVLLTALSRIGRNSKVAMTHDVAQRDNLRVGKYDGVSSVVNKLSGSPLFGHISLRKSERSEIAELVSSVLDS